MPIEYRIHPAIGVARVGDSPDDFFIGPEAPGIPPTLTKPDAPPAASGQRGTYKDTTSHVKRQGARFRVYEYTTNVAGAVTRVREITAADARIEWEVHLANRKAAARRIPDSEAPPTGERRNKNAPEKSLIIDAGPHSISGASQRAKRLHGRFMEKVDVPIGDVLTDAAGRLIVLGGFGKSQSVPPGAPVDSFANNDGWCDDTSDGPVRAKVTLKGTTQTVEADPAWVLVAPPDFAPPIENVITLYDVVYDQTAQIAAPSLAVTDLSPVSFTKDIYPLLRRVSMMHWVSGVAASPKGHAEAGINDFISKVTLLSSNRPDAAPERSRIFGALRNPRTGIGKMPKLPERTNKNVRAPFVTETQYKRMERWSQGTFDADWTGAEPTPVPFDRLPDTEKPAALDRAALEACVGGPFFPGIEVSSLMLEATTYDPKRPFRINTQLEPGTLTAPMAIPWQADFRDCGKEGSADWWPGQRPTHVFGGGRTRAGDWVPNDWDRVDMVNQWMRLGFIVEDTSRGKTRYVEDERDDELV
jgi:L-Lysine epsilon oxidase N-terminal/L-lysine epsilon oxidase C-terminal domain